MEASAERPDLGLYAPVHLGLIEGEQQRSAPAAALQKSRSKPTHESQ